MQGKRIILFILILAFIVSCIGCSGYDINNKYNSDLDMSNIGEEIINDYLSYDLWISENMYDANYILQVPLEAAFRNNNRKLKDSFSNQFSRFIDEYNVESISIDKSRLDFLNYLFLSSRFISLSYQYNELTLIPEGLVDIVYDNINSIYFEEEAWQWDREPFKNMEERIEWKLTNNDVDKSYYRAIIDEELFVFATAANLRQYYIENESQTNLNNLESILNLAIEVFKQESYFSEEGNWLFQVGVWEEHPDYLYAGNLEKQENIEPIVIKDILTDSSHFSRFPLFINNFIRAYENEKDIKEFFIKIQKGLEKQFLDNVLIEPSQDFNGYRLNNFMDGNNGVYRWNYKTQGIGNGYGPYELSGTFFLGWWSFLESEPISNAYKYMLEQYPLDRNLIELYTGPNTSRERNKYVRWPEYFENELSKEILRMIVEMPLNKIGQ